MAEAAISFTVQKLGDLAIDKVIEKARFLRGVEEQVKWLKDELETMQCFLKDAAGDQKNFETISKWIKDIRQVAYDAEDVIETFILEVDNPKRSRGLLGKCAYFPNHLYNLDRVGEQIESIRKRLKQIDERLPRYTSENVRERNASPSSRRLDIAERRRLSPWQRDRHLVGLDESVEFLLRKAILDEKKGLSISSIVGMGGIGKSTLARVVYNHAEVARRFDRHAWVVVSKEFNHTETIKELVLQLLEPNEDKLKVLELIEKSPAGHLNRILYDRLKGKRYCIVVDDVWRQQDWQSLSSAFPDEEDIASRLIVTTRIDDVPKSGQYVHKMKTLDFDKSLKLLLKIALNDNNDTYQYCTQELEYIGREIVAKCNGLPLAITVVGGLLQEQRQTKSEWEKVLKGINSHLGTSESNYVQAILELSYHDLPSNLKSCFLCLALLEENVTINAHKLVKLWIGEGLVPQKEGQETMEDTARGYLHELINRNMIQVRDIKKNDAVKNCEVHDLLRELSIRKAKEEMNLEILKDKGNISQSVDHKSRHCVTYCNNEGSNISSSGNVNKHLRSLFFYRGGGHNINLKSFRLLRVLEMERLGLRKFPPTISALTGLRYLNLRHNFIGGKLPKSLGRLRNLQVLDLAKNREVEVPNVLWQMKCLRCIKINGIVSKVPLKMDTLKNLRTLVNIHMDSLILEHLTQLTSLCKLGIKLDDNSDVSKLWTSLTKLENLVSLKLYKRGGYEYMPSMDGLCMLQSLTSLKLEGPLSDLPNFPPNLSHLTLTYSQLDKDPMPVLEKLHKLVYFKLGTESYNSNELEISHEGFPSLEVLYLDSIDRLRNIKIRKGGMPKLKRLKICRCFNLDTLPKEFSSLQELKVVTTMEKASQFQVVNSHIISMIPFVQIVGE